MSEKYEKICAIIQTSCTRAEQERNDVRNDYHNAHVAVKSYDTFSVDVCCWWKAKNGEIKGNISKETYTHRKFFLPLKHIIIESADQAH